jgi:hypothetical protein
MREFRIIVPCKPRKRGRRIIEAVSYPFSGYPLYTKEEAIELLKEFPDSAGAYAESETRRFALDTLDIA